MLVLHLAELAELAVLTEWLGKHQAVAVAVQVTALVTVVAVAVAVAEGRTR